MRPIDTRFMEMFCKYASAIFQNLLYNLQMAEIYKSIDISTYIYIVTHRSTLN